MGLVLFWLSKNIYQQSLWRRIQRNGGSRLRGVQVIKFYLKMYKNIRRNISQLFSPVRLKNQQWWSNRDLLLAMSQGCQVWVQRDRIGTKYHTSGNIMIKLQLILDRWAKKYGTGSLKSLRFVPVFWHSCNEHLFTSVTWTMDWPTFLHVWSIDF